MADTAHIADTASKRPPAAPARAQLGPHTRFWTRRKYLQPSFYHLLLSDAYLKWGKKKKPELQPGKRSSYRICSVPLNASSSTPPQAPLRRSAGQCRPGQARPSSTRALTAAVPARPRPAPQCQAARWAAPRRRAAPEPAPGPAQRRGPRPGRAQPPHRPSPPPLRARGRLPLPASGAPLPVAGLAWAGRAGHRPPAEVR